MGKLSVIMYITVALLLLFIVSRSPKHSFDRRHGHLKIRSNFTFSRPPDSGHANTHHQPVAFDPLVAEIERRREDKEWERHMFFDNQTAAPGEEAQPEWEDFMDAEDYLNDQERFNVTNRLLLLFPKIDVDPTNGFVTEKELTEWNLQLAQREVMHRTVREMELYDKNHDGFVSFSEYEPPEWVRTAGDLGRMQEEAESCSSESEHHRLHFC
ncbi:hypothetical protein RJ641_011996 [Dillenia turbinata]|uniref:EF-hand domain-containing protein n=1 Tax=Dillenia turbinata TaxID=194707 RepID=A0AAN8UVJ4_9MAGN